MVISQNIYALNLPWDEEPLSLLDEEQQLWLKQRAQVNGYTTGEILWSTHDLGVQMLLVSGNVRLIQEPGKKVLLQPGDWFGDLLELEGSWQARAASKEVIVVLWQSEDWYTVATLEQRILEQPALALSTPRFQTSSCCI